MEIKYSSLIDELRSAHQSDLEKVKDEAQMKEQDLIAQIKNLTITNQSLLSIVRLHKKNFKIARTDQKSKRKSYSRK